MANAGRLELEVVDVDGDPIAELVDIHLHDIECSTSSDEPTTWTPEASSVSSICAPKQLSADRQLESRHCTVDPQRSVKN